MEINLEITAHLEKDLRLVLALAQGRRIDGTFQERFFLISHMSFNPYGPSWMEVHRKVDDVFRLVRRVS